MKAQSGEYSFFYLGGRWVRVDVTPQPPGKRPGIHCSGSWAGPKVGLDGYGKPNPTGIRSPDRPTRSDSPTITFSIHF
jgi:hypothetical protein